MSAAAGDLLAALVARSPGAAPLRLQTTPWCSAGFSGERHEILLGFPDPETARGFSIGLPDHQFALPDRLVADIGAGSPVTCGGGVHVTVEALTIETA